MGVLVNPVGWRLRANILWKVNFYVVDPVQSLQINNQRVYYRILRGVLSKINNRLFRFGYLKFIRQFVYVHGSQITIFLTFRFFRDTLSRHRWGRGYKYNRRRIKKEKRLAGRRRRWLSRAVIKFHSYSIRISKYKKQIRKLNALMREGVLDFSDKRIVAKLLVEKKRRLWFVRVSLSKLKTRLYRRCYSRATVKKWGRPWRALFSINKLNKIRAVSRYKMALFEAQRRKFLRLFVWYGYRRGRRLRFNIRIKGRAFNKFPRFLRYIPARGSRYYVRHKQIVGRYFKKVVEKRPFALSYRLPKHFRVRSHRKRKRFFIAFRNKKRRKGKRKFLSYNKLRLLRRRLRWRKAPRFLQMSPSASRVYNLLFLTWKLVPFLIEVKKFLFAIFVRLANKRRIALYMLNASKYYSVDANAILDFIVSFLKRRRRITKINKIFYRIIRIIRFFKAKYKLRGFKLLMAGRFLRRDRATYVWRTRGAVPLGTKLAKIDFAARSIQMKYSKPIVKLWICKK